MPAIRVLKNADVYAPAPLGRRDLVLGGGKVLAIADLGTGERLASALVGKIGTTDVVVDVVDVIDVGGARVVPGLIDCHVHSTGGGGESGPEARVPPIVLSSLTTAGVTTCVGVLGTDSTTRTMRDLVGRTLGLRKEGINAWCYTGSYEVPVKTLTGSVRDDIVFVDSIVGVGELAISDHRSSQPTFEELCRIAADCHVAGMMSGKAGLVHFHLGDGRRGLTFINRALDETEIPARTFHPTHVNRQRWLFDDAMALARRGCVVDVTAFDPGEEGIAVEDCIERWLDEGLPAERLTVSSDGSGCLPVFDADGVLVEMDIGRPATVAAALRTLLQRGRALEVVLPFFTSNLSRLFRFHGAGVVAVGGNADLVVLGDDGAVVDVYAAGRTMVRAGVPTVLGPFEAASGRGSSP